MAQLDGVALADFRQRAIAFAIDAAIAFALSALTLILGSLMSWAIVTRGTFSQYTFHFHLQSELGRFLVDIVIPVLYFGLFTYWGDGQTPGKRWMKIRVVSLVHTHVTLWHSIERALGYGAAALEFGFGFAQFFIHPQRRTVQDRIAETIVVKNASLQNMLRP
jgi:uncharacterized RDD family membrane protein YckC